VHQFMTPRNCPMEDVDHASGAGADGIGISEWKCAGVDEVDLSERLRDAGLAISSYLPSQFSLLPMPIPLMPDQVAEPGERLRRQCVSVERAARIGAKLVVVVLGPGDTERDRMAAAGALGELGDAAASRGIDVAVEYLSRPAVSVLPDWTPFLDFVAGVDRSNIGVVLDVQHLVGQPDMLETSGLWADRVWLAQVSGVPVVQRSPFDRLLPGDGRPLLEEFVQALLDAGFRGWWELEVLSDDGRYGTQLPDSLWTRPHRAFVADAVDRFQRILQGTSVGHDAERQP
jgi:sugar phosphate isomerase/epimerase